MRFVSECGFVLDDVYITSIGPGIGVDSENPDRLRIGWRVDIKPLAVDEILWTAFLPDVVFGPRMRINRRINGAFTVSSLRVHRGSRDVLVTGAPDWEPILDEFERVRADFVAAHPTPADYVLALEDSPEHIAPSSALTRMVTALIAAGRTTDAVAVAEDAIARGEGGGMWSEVDVLKYLAAYAKGPEAYAAFTASLLPTHDYQVLYESRSCSPTGLSREHHRGSMRLELSRMDGCDPWAVILSARVPDGEPQAAATERYLQAAGTAEAMVIEIRQPAQAAGGVVSVRSVLGHRHTGTAERDVEIVLPSSTQTVTRHEVFSADEAADLFEAFYRTDTIGDGYTLRPAEGYIADGSPSSTPNAHPHPLR
ncbi:hypothetical protein KIH27_04850 [Mycobacterium sp. M1]|uniref:Uncharacterized protein n=1 Tax=Mycolicibacter acidiphilus TaxID=2835306 RepID=A0ABS5RF63_9MYCO|nr:hypothetical protein [Mycolicibacter acidiphilus]MBS9532916.1 hypothetical protein [Mycolicibacter acidiphilus]